MPLMLVRARDAATLYTTCAGRFLDQVGDTAGPDGCAAHLWMAQESQVDLLYEHAYARGVPGWLGPPVTLLRRLGERFEIRTRRIGLLTRRRVIARIAREVARDVGLRDPSRADGVVRGHMLDALFGELLPEGVTPEALAAALDGLRDDDTFARRRNDWIVGSYRGYLAELQRRDRIDARQTSARVAERIEAGELRGRLAGAGTLHVYGLYMLRSRQRLLTALARQADVEARLYVLAPSADDPEAGEWETFASAEGCAIEDLVPPDGAASPAIRVQPAPDTQRETEWVARQVKRLLVEHDVAPHRVAVVARSGEEDTGRMHRALRDAGIVATTLVRSRLTEIAALKALMSLFRGAATGWPYRALRPVLDNALFDLDVDLRTIDFIARTRRVEGLESWTAEIERLIEKLGDTYEDSDRPRDRALRGSGLWLDAVRRDLERFRPICAALQPLAEARTEAEWIELTLALLRDEHPAAFHLRRRLCDPAGARGGGDEGEDRDTRWDVVRLDQRGVRQTELLLREWLDLDHRDEPLTPEAWRQLLQRMLEANELSLTTPVHKGVQVLEAHDAALLPFEHVFVIRANDGIFPRAVPAGGVVSNDERARLREAGVPVTWRDLELRRERALWRAVTSAGAVTVTYRTADPTGTPLLPSLLVPEHEEADELPRLRTRHEGDQARFTPVTAAQADQRAAVAFHDWLAAGEKADAATDAGDAPPPLHAGTPGLLPHAVLAAVAEAHRDTGAAPLAPDAPALRPNPWNGWVRDPRVLEKLAARFGEDHRWSASRLEAYSKLPFQFLLEKVLYFEEAEEAEEEVTPLVFGASAHDLLERFYAAIKDDLPASFDARAEAAFQAAAEATLAAARANDDWLGAEVLWEPEWRRIRDQVRGYLEWELPHLADKGERPELIEHEFGFGDEQVRVEGKDVAGRRASLRICGRIDRVDRGGKGDQVLDYKSGATPGANDYQDGTALQAPLYMQVLENAGRTVHSGYYRSLKPARNRTQYAGKIERHKDVYDAALRYALSVPGRIRAGLFEPVASAKSGGFAPWHAGRDIARSQAKLPDGNRYEHVEPLQPEPAPDPPVERSAAPSPDGPAGPAADGPPRLPFDTAEGDDA